MNNRDKRSLQGITLGLCALAAFIWAPAVQADEPYPGRQCVIDTAIIPEGSTPKDLDFTLDFQKAKEIKCLGYLVLYSRSDFSQGPEPGRSISNRAARLIREASVSHPAFAEYREKCARENAYGELIAHVFDPHGGRNDFTLVPVLASVDETCQGRY